MKSDHKKAISHAVSLCPIWPARASEKIGNMLDEIRQSNSIISKISLSDQHVANKAGFAAETWHAESFNLDAILKDQKVRAFTDRFKGTPLRVNDQTNDIVIMSGDQQVLGAQLKYYQTANKTKNEFRKMNDGVHKYNDCDVYLGPSDQLEGIKTAATKDALKNQETRPEIAKAAEKVRDGAADKIQAEGVESTPLSKRDAEKMGAGTPEGKDKHETMQEGYLNKATVQQTIRAASSAAIITTVIAGSINTFQYMKHVQEGNITAGEATRYILQETVIAAGDSALKAGAATATVSMLSRSVPALFTGSVFRRSFANSGIAGAAVCAVDVVQCLVLYAAGKITLQELETRTGKNLFQTGAGAAGASVGAAVGVLGGPAGMLAGSVIGGVITTLAMNIAIDNHIEKSFRLTLNNTQQLVSTGAVMQDAMGYLTYSQEYYAEFIQGLRLSEQHFDMQIKRMEKQSISLRNKINNL